MFACVATVEGGWTRGRFRGNGKYGLLAGHFGSTLAASPEVLVSRDHCQLAASAKRRSVLGTLERVTGLDVIKAIGNQATGRSPGPDSFAS